VPPGFDRASATSRETGNGKPVLDRNAALERVEGDAVLLAELADLFVGDCPQMQASIHDALEHGDSDALARAAHTVKGSVANFAAGQAFEAALNLEQTARRGDLTSAAGAVEALDGALEELCEALAGVAKETTP